jgi:hypothetical protein
MEPAAYEPIIIIIILIIILIILIIIILICYEGPKLPLATECSLVPF